MTIKEFVLKHCPTAFWSRTIGFTEYQICTIWRMSTFQQGVGATASKAWVAAAENIAKEIVLKKCPKAELLQPKTGLDFVVYDPISCVVLSKSTIAAKAWIKAAESIE